MTCNIYLYICFHRTFWNSSCHAFLGTRTSFSGPQQGTVMRQLVFAQKMLQSDTHQGRLEYFKDILDEEYRASIAKKSLKNL